MIVRIEIRTYLKAFVLNALVGAVICAMAIEFRLLLEDEKNEYYGFWARIYNEKKLNIFHKLGTTLLITFLVSILVYHVMYFLFLFGGGQLNLVPSVNATFKELIQERKSI